VLSEKLVGSIYYNPLKNETVQSTETSHYKLIKFNKNQLFLPSQRLEDQYTNHMLCSSRLTPLKSGTFLLVDFFYFGCGRMTVFTGDLKSIACSKYMVDFNLYDCDYKVVSTSSGRIVLACDVYDFTCLFIFDEKLSLLLRKQLDYRVSAMTANRSLIFCSERHDNQTLVVYDFSMNVVNRMDEFSSFIVDLRADDSNRLFVLNEISYIRICQLDEAGKSVKSEFKYHNVNLRTEGDLSNVAFVDGDRLAYWDWTRKVISVFNMKGEPEACTVHITIPVDSFLTSVRITEASGPDASFIVHSVSNGFLVEFAYSILN
jgi:hypothetical protein